MGTFAVISNLCGGDVPSPATGALRSPTHAAWTESGGLVYLQVNRWHALEEALTPALVAAPCAGGGLRPGAALDRVRAALGKLEGARFRVRAAALALTEPDEWGVR